MTRRPRSRRGSGAWRRLRSLAGLKRRIPGGRGSGADEARGPRRRRVNRKAHRELGAAPGLALEADGAPMHPHEPAGDREPEPGAGPGVALGRRLPVLLEDGGPLLLRDPWSRVDDARHHEVSVQIDGQIHMSLSGELYGVAHEIA